MKYSKSKHPKYIKHNYRNKEFIWVKVKEQDENAYYGTIDNNPVTKSIKKGDRVKVNKSKVVEIIKYFL